jgi:hypothetical protein
MITPYNSAEAVQSDVYKAPFVVVAQTLLSLNPKTPIPSYATAAPKPTASDPVPFTVGEALLGTLKVVIAL